MADNHIDFKYLSYVQDNPVFWLRWSFPLGLCFQENRRIYKNRYHRLPSARRNGKKQHLLKFSNKCRITFNG
jgi:hypothetical protein